MKLLVTGGAGFIGSNFVRRILDGTIGGISKIRVLDKLTYAGNLENFTQQQLSEIDFHQGDINDRGIVKDCLDGIDAVVNFAAESHVDRSIGNSSEFLVTNSLGTLVLLEEALQRDIPNFVQVSTDEVYGSISNGSWNESQPLLPNSPYSASKAGADLICRAFNRTHGMNVKITRCSNNYGYYQYPEKLIPLLITNIITGKRLPIYGEGLNRRDWLHVDDHCQAIYKVLMHGQSGQIYNIGGGTELSNLEITQLILDHFQLDKTIIDFVPDRKGHDFRYSVDDSKIRNELNYLPTINFEIGLASTISWYENNSSWWKKIKK
jgi:dTDP-glucose 4,6-dehydratase